MRSLEEEYFDDDEFGSVSLDDLDIGRGFDKSDDPEDWTYVRARTQSRGVLIVNDGIYRVYKSTSTRPLVESGTEALDESDMEERIPSRLWDNKVVPSPSGEYLTVIEVTSRENDDGTIRLETTGRTSKIPVEFVREQLTYDEVVVDFLD